MTLLELSEIIREETGKDFFNEDVCNDILCDDKNGSGSIRYDDYYIEFTYNPEEVDCKNLLKLEIETTEEIKN